MRDKTAIRAMGAMLDKMNADVTEAIRDTRQTLKSIEDSEAKAKKAREALASPHALAPSTATKQ